MQSERVTFLTSADHKAALDAYAAANGQSVGNVVREATAHYIAQPPADEYEEALNLLLPELEAMLGKWNRQFDSMEAALDRAHEAVRESLRRVEATK
jgi:hypothetical protein